MSDGRGGVSALVRAAVASADASSLKVLDLSFNALVSLDDDDGTPVASGGVFASLPALEDLRVGDNKLTTLQSRNLERVGDRLRSLRAQNNALESLTGVEKLRALETLRVDGNPSLSASPRVTFASLPSSLTSLNLSRCALTSLDGFRDAAAARRLEELRLDGNFFASPSVFEPLKNCQRLVELHVADARLTPASLAGLRALAPTLETLVLDGNKGLAPESDAFEPANQNKVATENARRFRLDAETKKNKNVSKEKEPERFTFVLALHRAPRLPALTSLSVSRCGARRLGPSGWSLADVAPKLERLDASRNALADAAALETGSSLRRLKEVVLAGNPMCFWRLNEVATFHSPETNENENGLSGEEDAERETASSDATKKSLETYLQTVTAALPRVAFVDHVAVKKAARGKPPREKRKQRGGDDGAEKSAAKSSDVVSVDGSEDDDSQDDLSEDLSEELSDEELSDVSGLSDLEADARDAVRVRDGAVRRGSDAGADGRTESGAELERKEGKKAVASPSEVVSAFRSAMIAHDREMRASLARVRAALAATPGEAAAALRRDGTFLAAGRDVPSRTLPPAPTLETLAPAPRVGDSFSKRAYAPVLRGKDTKDAKDFPMSVSEETRRIDRVSAPAGDETGKKNAKADPAPASASSARVSSAAQSVAALKARRRAASAAGGFGGFRVPSATQKTA
jgi:hypothetical protein